MSGEGGGEGGGKLSSVDHGRRTNKGRDKKAQEMFQLVFPYTTRLQSKGVLPFH